MHCGHVHRLVIIWLKKLDGIFFFFFFFEKKASLIRVNKLALQVQMNEQPIGNHKTKHDQKK
jgi:hypothetical protein